MCYNLVSKNYIQITIQIIDCCGEKDQIYLSAR